MKLTKTNTSKLINLSLACQIGLLSLLLCYSVIYVTFFKHNKIFNALQLLKVIFPYFSIDLYGLVVFFS